MKKLIVTTPTAPISNKISSHRGAQGVIYADQIANWPNKEYMVAVNFGGKITDYSDYDVVAVYHGNDWGGSMNMFGGVKAYGNIDSLISLSNFKGEVWSLAIPFPEYSKLIKPRVDKEPDAHPDWKKVNWERLAEIESTAKNIDPNNFARDWDRIAIGDSHGISMYRPGWMINSVPYKTLYGALEVGLDEFVDLGVKVGENPEIEFYFGNIDIRHHLCRQPNPAEATRELVTRYVDQCKAISQDLNASVKIWEPLPIENESRKLPKTGYYKGTPFYGTWKERNEIRNVFIETLKEKVEGKVELFQWTQNLINDAGELDFECMEKPQSVHLSREYYPHWQGKNAYYNWHF